MGDTYDVATEAMITMETWADKIFDCWLTIKQTHELSDMGLVLNEKGEIAAETKRTKETRGMTPAWYVEQIRGPKKLTEGISAEKVDLFMGAYKRKTGMNCLHVRGIEILDFLGPEMSCVKHRAIAKKAKDLAALVEQDQNNSIGTAEAAEILGITPVRVNQLIKSGRLNAAMVSGIYVLDRQEIETFSQMTRRAGKPKNEHDAMAAVADSPEEE